MADRRGRRSERGYGGWGMDGNGLSSAAVGERVFAFEAFAEQPAGADIAFGVIGFGGVGKDYTGRGCGVDETENSGGGVGLAYDTGMAYAAFARAALEENEVAFLEFFTVFYLLPQPVLRSGAAGEGETEFHIDVAGKSGTVEYGRAFASIAVGFAKMQLGLLDEEVGGIGHSFGHKRGGAVEAVGHAEDGGIDAAFHTGKGTIGLSPSPSAAAHECQDCYCMSCFSHDVWGWVS